MMKEKINSIDRDIGKNLQMMRISSCPEARSSQITFSHRILIIKV